MRQEIFRYEKVYVQMLVDTLPFDSAVLKSMNVQQDKIVLTIMCDDKPQLCILTRSEIQNLLNGGF